MEAQQRRVRIMPNVFVKLVVFLVLDVALAARPQSLLRVQLLAIQLNRHRHKARVALDDFLQLPAFGEILLLLVQVQRDLRAALDLSRRLNLVTAAARRSPLPALLLALAGTRFDGDLVRDHERGIKAHAELPN